MALFDHHKEPSPALPSDTDIEAGLNLLPGAGESAPQPAPAHAADPSQPIIVFDNVSISFDGRSVLENVSFFVNRGETLCILGRSGVGKSVSGTIQVEGQEITTLSEEGLRAIRKRITMVFQNGGLFDSMSVRENVAFPLREKGALDEDQVQQIVDRLIRMVGAEDVEESLPASLSTGRRRAVAMARAIAAQPEH